MNTGTFLFPLEGSDRKENVNLILWEPFQLKMRIFFAVNSRIVHNTIKF